ncbi:MAG TPA: tripartite tricarboxylate transporter substrate binding protein [Caldimonas sp.]|jgi:tripartite-type tricarboxylate transporter receptor subunit TctC|nr:tripartite tricarboxylate transporter substrate binding protein [Caldimonas sp.]HEX2540364.1 tripartite tricarboxylate transporter substrate binding protein [Caldimonas sp.]
MSRSTVFARRALLASLLAAPLVALAADPYPTRPIRLIVPYAAGGTTDQLARVLQEPLQQSLGQTIVIENKAGAGGSIGTQEAVRAAPDGYTLVFGNNGPNALLGLMRSIPYDPQKDLRGVSLVALTPMFLTVPGDSPVKTLKDFLPYAKSAGDKLNIGSVGQGSFSHVAAESFKQRLGLSTTHIPYNGGAPLMTAFAGGQIQVAFVTGLDGATLERSGKVRYLAVAAPNPTPAAPGLPTVAEIAPGFTAVSWFGVFAPAGTPDAIVSKLNAAIVAAVARPEVQKFFIDRNVEGRSSTPQGLEKMVVDDMAEWGPVIKKAKIQL